MPTVLLATCAELPAGDEDAPGLVAALSRLGVEARWAVWTDAGVDWGDNLVVLRCTWDYTLQQPDFLAWTAAVRRLANPACVVAWNTDKTYLHELAAAGVPTVPTTVLEPGAPVAATGREIVVKPSVGAGSRGIGRFTADRLDDARRHADQLRTHGRTVLVQPYLAEVDTHGETALVYFDGRYSHAIRKGAMLPPTGAHSLQLPHLYVEEHIQPREASPAELAVGEQVVRVVRERFGDLLYARVDLLATASGPVVVELELTEPSLFLGHHEQASERFAAAIAARV